MHIGKGQAYFGEYMANKTILIYKKGNLIGSSGGVEKFVSWFSGALSRQGYKVFVATRDKKDGELFYPLDKAVTFHHFRVHFSRIRRILEQIGLSLIPYFNRELFVAKMLRAYCDEIKPDVIIAEGIQDLADIVYDNPYPCKKIVQLHSEPSVFFTKKKRKLFEQTLKQADLVQVLLPSFVATLKRYYGGKIIVIGNPIFQSNLKKNQKKIIIYPARIEKDKQQHLLIEAFARIAKEFPDWQVHLWGSATKKEYQQQCINLIQKYDLEAQVKLMGVTNQMNEKLAEASVCAFPSRFEGFSLALSEAMAVGIPCVGFEKSSGVNSLIQQDKTGFLVKDIDGFSLALKQLMIDEELRQKFGQNAQQFCERYTPDAILKLWQEVLNAPN